VTSWVIGLIGDPGITAEDNFLDVGGHSMLALELNAKAREEFGQEFDIEVLFGRTLREATADVLRRRTATDVMGEK